MKRNNRGYTLVELLVSVVILGIVAVAVTGFMASGTRGYSSVTSAVSLQYKSQLAINHVQEYVIDCSAGLCFDDDADTLYIINGDLNTGYSVHIFKYDAAQQSLYYGASASVTTEADGSFSFSNDTPDLLADGVTSFDISLQTAALPDGDDDPDNDPIAVTDASLSIGFSVRGKHFTGEQTVALRNRPLPATVTVS